MRQRELQTTPSSSELLQLQPRASRLELPELDSPNLSALCFRSLEEASLPAGGELWTASSRGGVLRRELLLRALTLYKLVLHGLTMWLKPLRACLPKSELVQA